MKQNVFILGAGIGGLTVAHELTKFSPDMYNITIYERNEIIGGMARSSSDYSSCPSEYCWRIYGPNYNNLRDIFSEIPLKNNRQNTVKNNLVDLENYIVSDQNQIFFMNNTPQTLFQIKNAFKNIPFNEKFNVVKKILYCFCICTERLNDMDNMSWKEYIDPDNKLSPDMKKYIIYIMAPYLGADYNKVNVPSVIKTLESFSIFNKPLSVMNSPTNEAFFDHWEHYLKSQGVKINLNSNIDDILFDNTTKKISGIIVNNKHIGNTNDIYICSLPVESVAKLTKNIPDESVNKCKELQFKSKQLMVGIQLYFDNIITFPKNKGTGIYIPDSPWQLIIEPQQSIWKTFKCKNKNIKDMWSIGLCDNTKNGLLTNKKFTECSENEIINEVWYQILSQPPLVKLLKLQNINIIGGNLWHTYKFDGNKMYTNEPKFSTNKNTWKLRPDNKTSISNFIFATGYTKTKTDMFEMEGAAESGRRAAKLINKNVKIIESYRPVLFSPLRFIDKLIYKNKINKYILIIVIFYIFSLNLKKYYHV